MASNTYSDGTTTYYGGAEASTGERGGYGAGGQVFLWIAWSIAFAFWAFTLSSFVGILTDIHRTGAQGLEGGIDAGGAGWLMMEVVGVVVLGAGIAWGAARWATRDKRLDPMTEASTAALYDSIEKGGDEAVSRSPEARRPQERDSFRPA